MFEKIITGPTVNFSIDPVFFIFAMFEALLLSAVVVYFHRRRMGIGSEGFQLALYLMAPLVTLVLLFIGSNLALSIGMVGALSIVRFRTVIKHPVDLMFLFLQIAVGLGCGTYNYVYTAIGVLIVLLVIWLFRPMGVRALPTVVMIRDEDSQKIQRFCDDFARLVKGFQLERLELSGKTSEAMFVGESSDLTQQTLIQLREQSGIEYASMFTRRGEY